MREDFLTGLFRRQKRDAADACGAKGGQVFPEGGLRHFSQCCGLRVAGRGFGEFFFFQLATRNT